MKKQKIFILVASLVTSYSSLEATSQKEMLITRPDAKDQSIHMQGLVKKQEIERAEKQRVAKQEEYKTDQFKKQEIEEQRNLIHNLEVDEDHFMADSILIPEER